ncbi:MAG: hypothetical protein K1X72_23315 [Pyrinomonadaceae bacterium]|nr:hypothetical protein [Pyrinomonadaceae bacterium]
MIEIVILFCIGLSLILFKKRIGELCGWWQNATFKINQTEVENFTRVMALIVGSFFLLAAVLKITN